MSDIIYMDAAASSPIAPEALSATVSALEQAGNPSASHEAGRAAADTVALARTRVARLLNASPHEIIFVSSATEANNLAIRAAKKAHGAARNEIVTTSVEHPSVLEGVRNIAVDAIRGLAVGVNSAGEIDLDDLERSVTERTRVVSVHAANNETGVIQPIRAVAAIARRKGALLHADASQLMQWGQSSMLDECDLVTVSSHKMHGPQGAAALVIRPTAADAIRPLAFGGGQERGLRSGTSNVAALAGFGAAAELSLRSGAEAGNAVASLRSALLRGLRSQIGDIVEHGAGAAARLPGILNVAIGAAAPFEFDGEALLARAYRLAASTGSACHSGAPGSSPVLAGMGVPTGEASRSIRLSLSRYTTTADIDGAVQELARAWHALASLGAANLELNGAR